MIEHEGYIRSIDGDKLTVSIIQNSACSECHARKACMAADTKEKMVDVIDTSGSYQVNERVVLLGKTSIGYRAIMWAFAIPLIILIVGVWLSTSTWNLTEMQSALVALCSLVPYYTLLYMLRHKMAGRLAFTINKSN